MGKIPNIIEALESPALFGPVVGPLKSWAQWLCFLRTLYGLPFNEEDAAIFKACTGREAPAAGGYPEAYAIVGRRGGKSRVVSLIAAYEAIFGGWTDRLSPGERGWIFVIATDKMQAKICLDYCRSALKLFPDLIEREYQDEIHLTNRISIATRTASYRASRGYTTALAICDEAAFFHDENSANPISEILTSILPGLMSGGRLICISTPFGRMGLLWEMHKNFFGKESDILVWQASTQTMNPTFSDAVRQRLIARDPVSMRSEFDATFREDIEAFIPLELLTAAATREQSLPDLRNRYVAFCDPSGGRQDSMTLAICHIEGDHVLLDRIEEKKSPFDPAEVVTEFSALLKAFGIAKCTADRFGGVWVSDSFKKQGITIEMSDLSASDIYLEFQPLLSMGKVKILKSDRLLLQLQQLERRTGSGRDRVDHPAGAGSHDDLANAVAGACVFASRNRIVTLADMEKRLPIKSGHNIPRFIERASEQALEDEMADFLGGGRIVRR
jgi:hypothetical protein